MRRAGFTLIEVLVALSIFALVSLSGVALLRLTLDNQAAMTARLDRLAAFERTRAFLALDLSQAADRPVVAQNGIQWPPFQTRADAETARTLLVVVRRGWENPEAAPRASLQYVEYELVDGALRRRTRPMLDGSALGEPAVLLTGVTAYSVSIHDGVRWFPVAGRYDGPPPAAFAIELVTDQFGPLRQAFLVGGGP